MVSAFFSLASWLLAALAGVGIAYQGLAIVAVRGFFAAKPASLSATPLPVTLMKPLHGAEPHLAANLASFLAQAYPAPVQMLCGVNTPDDAAVATVRALIAEHPEADIALATGPVTPAANAKIANLTAMLPHARHGVLVLSDSDMVVGPDYLARVIAALAAPGVGAVSCFYVGRGDAGLWSRLGAALISFQAMPNMILATHFGLERPCMGSTIALRRDTLGAIGGFAGFGDVLADDYAIGESVAKLGLKVAIPPLLLTHAGAEASMPELWRHLLRWAVTIRDLRPAGHYGSVVTQPLALALLAALAHPALGLALTLLAILARLALAGTMRRAAGRLCPPLWLVPLADLLGFAVFCASLVTRRVDWRGQALTLAANGRILSAAGHDP